MKQDEFYYLIKVIEVVECAALESPPEISIILQT